MPPLLVVTLLAALAPLAEARGLLDDKRPSEALAVLEQTVADGGLDEEQLLTAYGLMGRAQGMLGRGQQAQRAFAIALRVSPGWRLEDVPDPEVRGPWEAALAALPPDGRSLQARVTLEERGGARGLLVSLVADDMDLVAGARVLVGDAVVTTLPLSRGEPEVFHSLEGSVGPADLAVQLTDAYGNELERLPLEVVVEGGAGEADPEELRWLALSGGTLLGLGAVGVTAVGVWFAAVDGGNIEAPAGARTVGLVAVGVATGVIALGGGLVVLDFLLSPGE